MGMTRGPIYRFQRGEPIVIGQRVVAGDPAGYSVAALLKKTAGQVIPKPGAATAAEFSVSFVPANGDEAAHWLLAIGSDVTGQLPAGQYAVDAAFSIDGEVVMISEPAFIALVDSVSG